MRKSVGFGFMEQNAQSFHLTIRLNAADVVFVINVATIVNVAIRALFSEHLRTYVYKSNKIHYFDTKFVLFKMT